MPWVVTNHPKRPDAKACYHEETRKYERGYGGDIVVYYDTAYAEKCCVLLNSVDPDNANMGR